jgi:probable HAF family extracellular repeat protein
MPKLWDNLLVWSMADFSPRHKGRDLAMKHWFCGLMALGLFLGMAGQSTGQPRYSFTTIDAPDSLFREAFNATGINASGQIVGNNWDGITGHGFLLDQGSYTALDVPGASDTRAFGINASGQIVGAYTDASGDHGFLLDNGNYTTIDVPGATGTYATGLNASGQIVGWYSDDRLPGM